MIRTLAIVFLLLPAIRLLCALFPALPMRRAGLSWSQIRAIRDASGASAGKRPG